MSSSDHLPKALEALETYNRQGAEAPHAWFLYLPYVWMDAAGRLGQPCALCRTPSPPRQD